MLLLAISIALIFLAFAVFLLGVVGAWSPATLLPMKTFFARLGTRVTSLFGTHVTARFRQGDTPSGGGNNGNNGNCRCLACHAFDGIDLPIRAKHKLLPRLAGEFAEDLASEIEDFLAEADERA